jgi:branched-chain amino acid transport system ATP-binding protein
MKSAMIEVSSKPIWGIRGKLEMLKVENLSVYYGEYRAVMDASFQVAGGELVTFIGANGAGKTSSIRAILGLIEKSEGRIWFDGEEVSGLPSHERVKKGMRVVPEGRKIFPELTVLQNLMMGAYFIEEKSRLQRNLGRIYELFPILAERQKQFGGRLSGGEQQMLAIARALIGDPKLLLIDEISMGLMPIAVDKAFKLIKKINEDGVTILLVEQNAKKALSIVNRGYVMETGRIVLHDTSANLEKNPRIIEAYLGGSGHLQSQERIGTNGSTPPADRP